MAGDDASHYFLSQDCLIRVTATNRPHVPTSPAREWSGDQAWADSSGPDGWGRPGSDYL